jgi:hypothetical protein
MKLIDHVVMGVILWQALNKFKADTRQKFIFGIEGNDRGVSRNFFPLTVVFFWVNSYS